MTPPERMRILIAETQAAVNSALKRFLQTEPGLEVIGQVQDSQALLDEIQAGCPDLLLLDWDLPGAAEDGLMSTLRHADCRLRVIVLGVQPEAGPPALAAGADAFVYKGYGPEYLRSAIYRVLWETDREQRLDRGGY